jgi:PAS domain S-box-containing protein
MRTEELSLQALLDSAPDGFLVVDADGIIVWANLTAHALFGYPASELIGTSIEEFVPERLRAGHARHRAQYAETPRVRPMGIGLNLLARRKDGSEFPVEISLSPLRHQGDQLVTAVVRDVSERRRLEEERNLLSIELETERERDRIAMDLHDGIMQDVYAAALTLELALANTEDEKFAGAAAVEKAIDQLHGVVRDIRSYIFDLRPREFVGTLPEALTNLAQEFSQNSQIKTETELSDAESVDVKTAVALYHIVHESLSNIQRHAHADNVVITLGFRDGMGHLEVRDNGVGFDTSKRIPARHRGLRNMAARAASISGKIAVESRPGRGTTLRVEFPKPGD